MANPNAVELEVQAEYVEAAVAGYVDEQDENKVRGNWTGRLDFILSCLSYAVGLGNVWRFPYQCYKNGGGAFVFPFIMMLGLTGFPLFFLESSFGQYASSGVISIWKASPLFVGIGAAMFMVSFLVSIYYNVIIAWTFFYLVESFTSSLPWATCGNPWNTPACRQRSQMHLSVGCDSSSNNSIGYNSTCVPLNSTTDYGIPDLMNLTLPNNATATAMLAKHFKSPADEFFHNRVLDISDGIGDMGAPRWQLVLYLLLAWTMVCLCMIKGIKSSGRAVYFTSTFPYLVLLILLVRGLTLPGSIKGILFYITPQWEKLLSARVWCDAAVQIFFSLAPGWGGLITLSSYNKFKNNCLRDTYIVCVGDVLTSLFAGLVIFSILGYMAHDLGVDVGEVADEGAGLAFIVYPEVVTRLPAAPLWAILFFLMLITLGLGTQFAIVNTVHTTIIDTFPELFRHGRRPSYVMVAICLVCFLLGLPCVCRGGMYMLQLMDAYAASYSVLTIALTECIVLAWVYGYRQLSADIKLMLGTQVGMYWQISWCYVSPAALAAILIFILARFEPTSYGSYTFPRWAEGLGWTMSLASILCIPAGVIYRVLTADPSLTFVQKIKFLSRPTEDWGPTTFRSTSVRKVRHSSAGSIGSRLRHFSGASAASQPLSNTRATIEVPPPNYDDIVKDDITETTPLDEKPPTDIKSDKF